MEKRKRYTIRDLMSGVDYDATPKPKWVGNNTVEFVRKGVRIIRHFRTNVLQFYPDGTLVFDTAGYRTLTTRKRLNDFQNDVTIYQKNRIWYAVDKRTSKEFVFADGMTWNLANGIQNAGAKPNKKLVTKMRTYAAKFAVALPVELPGFGDCIFCSEDASRQGAHEIKDRHGVSLGDANRDYDHLMSHIEESYFVPSLLVRAMREHGAGELVIGSALTGSHRTGYFDQLLDSYRKRIGVWIYDYLYKRIVDGCFDPRIASDGFAVR